MTTYPEEIQTLKSEQRRIQMEIEQLRAMLDQQQNAVRRMNLSLIVLLRHECLILQRQIIHQLAYNQTS
jgi:hypothetical protein